MPLAFPHRIFESANPVDFAADEALVRHGMIDRQDLTLFRIADDPATALAQLQSDMAPMTETETPAIAHSRTPYAIASYGHGFAGHQIKSRLVHLTRALVRC